MVHLVQIGVLGWIGRFNALDRRRRPRGCQVVCRTDRGLETGQVLTALDNESDSIPDQIVQHDGQLLRRVTPDDQMILTRLLRHRQRAFEACTRLIQQRGLSATLVDVEHLFDGQNLYFYFLGDVGEELQQLTDELAETWEAKVRFRQFTERLQQGCGPACGSGSSGCGTSGCGSCSLRGGCATAGSTDLLSERGD